ncbi:MAG TPA: zf-HC2 domain-containing protein [Candidatus Acidoferrales bacterium]
MIRCQDVLDNLSCYIDGDGSEELRRQLEWHIARCPRCHVVFDTTQRTLRIIADADPFEVPLTASARLYERLAQVMARPGDAPA